MVRNDVEIINIQWKLPRNLKFKTLIKCVGGVKSCRPTPSHLSWSITDRLIPISRPHTFNPRLQAVKTFWPDFAPLGFFSKMFLTTEIAQILPGASFKLLFNLRKKGVRKKCSFLIFRPLMSDLVNPCVWFLLEYVMYMCVSPWLIRHKFLRQIFEVSTCRKRLKAKATNFITKKILSRKMMTEYRWKNLYLGDIFCWLRRIGHWNT